MLRRVDHLACAGLKTAAAGLRAACPQAEITHCAIDRTGLVVADPVLTLSWARASSMFCLLGHVAPPLLRATAAFVTASRPRQPECDAAVYWARIGPAPLLLRQGGTFLATNLWADYHVPCPRRHTRCTARLAARAPRCERRYLAVDARKGVAVTCLHQWRAVRATVQRI